ncbi:MAG: M14 family metallopeptidase [Bacteroidota bacterium]
MRQYLYVTTLLIASLILGFQSATQAQNAQEVFQAAGTPGNPKVQISFNRYYTPDGLEALARKITNAYPDLVKLSSIGKSYEGRELWMLSVTNYKKGVADRKPGFYVDGNIHSNEIQGAEIGIYTAWYLTEMYGENDFITELLDDRIFYIVPTINPDARHHYMKEVNSPNSPRAGLIPLDDDLDGFFDEDGFDDLDGDGSVTSMRRKSALGNYIVDPQDPRKMIAVGPDDVVTTQRYELLGGEGIDNDGDGRVNEDRKGYYDPNRDWGWNWQPDYIQRGAYKYPFSVPENRAVADFIKAHPNVAGAQSYHNSGGMILRGPGAREDVDTYNRADVRVYDAIGKKGAKLIPGYRYLVVYKDLYSVFGGELDWFYGGRGIYTFTNEIFTSFAYYKNKERNRNQRYDFDKELIFGDAFTDWKEYDHPTYGLIEIGGFKKNFGRNTPGFLLEEECHRNMAFTLYHAWHMPKLSISDVTEKSIGNGLTEITATIRNERLIPTHASQDLKYNIERPDYVTLSGANVLASMIVDNDDFGVTTEQLTKTPEKIRVENIPGVSFVKVRWIVKDKKNIKITVDSAKGGIVSR